MGANMCCEISTISNQGKENETNDLIASSTESSDSRDISKSDLERELSRIRASKASNQGSSFAISSTEVAKSFDDDFSDLQISAASCQEISGISFNQLNHPLMRICIFASRPKLYQDDDERMF